MDKHHLLRHSLKTAGKNLALAAKLYRVATPHTVGWYEYGESVDRWTRDLLQAAGRAGQAGLICRATVKYYLGYYAG